MAAVLQLPKLGLTMTEGTLAECLVPAGQPFRKGQPLYVLETEKVANEIEADEDGRLEQWLVEPGATVPVGTPIAHWTPAAGQVAAPAPATKPRVRLAPVVRDLAPAAPTVTAAPVRAGRVIATPYARRLAREAGLDLATVTILSPTRARITAQDVLRALEH